MKHRFSTILLSFSLLVVSACQQEPAHSPVTLKVAGMDPDMFQAGFGNSFMDKFPDIRLEVIPPEEVPTGGTTVENMKALITDKQPDIILTGTYNYGDFIRAGLLRALDTHIEAADFDKDNIPSTVLQKLRNDAQDGKLYALPASFSSGALLYNKDLFQQYHIEPPTGQLSWEAALELAKGVPQQAADGKALYGFYVPGQSEPADKAFYFINRIGMSEGLSIADRDNNTVTVNTEAWRKVWDIAVEAHRSGLLVNAPLEKTEEEKALPGVSTRAAYQPFLSGRAAMIVAESDIVSLLTSGSKPSFAWAAISHPGAYQTYMQPSGMFAISSQSAHAEEAWTFLSYAAGQELAQQKSAIRGGDLSGLMGKLPLRVAYLEEQLGVDLSAFYIQEPAVGGIYSVETLPLAFLQAYQPLAIEQLQLILDGKLTVEEGLTKLQAEAEVLWKQ